MIYTFEELYETELLAARSFEGMLVAALPAMARAADSSALRRAFTEHAEETRIHQLRVNDLILRHGGAEEMVDSAMRMMIWEAERLAASLPRGPLRDAGLIAAAERIEHYEIAFYGTLATFAKDLGLLEEKRILGTILDEEKAADETLTDIAIDRVNPRAIAAAA